MTRMINWIGNVLPWFVGLMLIFVGMNSNDPYLIWLRGAPNILVLVCGVFVAALLIRRSYRRSFGIPGTLLILIWVAAPLSMLSAHATFEWRKNAVLRTEPGKAHPLGRHFIVGYSSFDEVASLAERGLIAGVYVARHNIRGRSAEALKNEITALQERRRVANLPPLIVAADQEGGIVSHLSPALTALPALSTLAALPPDLRSAKAQDYGRQHGRELAGLGINLNFAPVLDLRPAQMHARFDFNTLIGQRAISPDPAMVADIALPYVRGLETFGVGATVKHFPGLGRVRGDTHHFNAELNTPPDELETTDWLPFKTVLSGSRARLMLGHVTLTAIDPDRPASHSRRVVDSIIRGKWNYQGIIITDDLVMGAIYQHDVCTAVVEALNAGVDLLLVAFDGAQFYRIFACASAGLDRGRLDPETLRASDMRLNGAISVD